MRPDKIYSTWIKIDLSAIENNIGAIRELTDAQIMAVVKANAYSHGSVPVAQAALRGGATWLGVARIEEALELRNAGLGCPILVLGYTPDEMISTAIEENVSMAVWNREQVGIASNSAQSQGVNSRLHLKVDTGMSRLGEEPEHTPALAELISSSPSVIYEGIFTHFARADEKDRSTTDDQEDIFRQVLSQLTKAGLVPPLVHAANSAALISRKSSHFTMVRPGIAIYGLHPSKECILPSNFRPALAWKTIISQVRTFPPGRGVSYGHEYITKSSERIGTLPVGYADGFRRVPGNRVLIGGKQLPVVGRVCMDQILVLLDDIPGVKEGEEVVLIGSQGQGVITAEQVADRWGTVNYEVICGLGPRIPRVY
jgi:alanine racemase